MRRRSVRTTAVPVPSLSEYIPPYCLAHSVNLDRVSQAIGLDSALVLQVCSFARNLVKISYNR